jgi:orotidine-5'-phosphate decarboxylase
LVTHFSDRLCNAVKAKKTSLTVGLDPVYSKLPKAIITHKDMNDEYDLGAAIDATFEFCTKAIRIVAPIVPAIKLNIAFFENYLWEGLEMYYSLIAEAKQQGLEVIADVKRGDIGHSAEQYAKANLRNSEFMDLEDIVKADAITVNGFAGAEGIEPFADTASDQCKGIFVWVRASNPSAAAIQDFQDANGLKMYEKLAEITAEIGNKPEHIGKNGYSNIGMVVGGTTAEQTAELRAKYPKTWFLVPGFGSQGATAQDCAKFCNADGNGALIAASRSIIYAYNDPKYIEKYGDDWEKCIEQAATDSKIMLYQALNK